MRAINGFCPWRAWGLQEDSVKVEHKDSHSNLSKAIWIEVLSGQIINSYFTVLLQLFMIHYWNICCPVDLRFRDGLRYESYYENYITSIPISFGCMYIDRSLFIYYYSLFYTFLWLFDRSWKACIQRILGSVCLLILHIFYSNSYILLAYELLMGRYWGPEVDIHISIIWDLCIDQINRSFHITASDKYF